MKDDFYDRMDALHYQYSRLPSGYGTVRFLGSRRKNPYAVHPPAAMTDDFKWKRPPAICYVPDRETGLKILALYHEGMYTTGLENDSAAIDTLFSSLMNRDKSAKDLPLCKAGNNTEADIFSEAQEDDYPFLPSDFNHMPEPDYPAVSRDHISSDTVMKMLHSYLSRMVREIEDTGTSSVIGFGESTAMQNCSENIDLVSPCPVNDRADSQSVPSDHTISKSLSNGEIASLPSKREGEIASLPSMREGEIASLPSMREGKKVSLPSMREGEIVSLPSMKEVYKSFVHLKFGKYSSRKLSKSSRNSSDAAYAKLEPFYERTLDDIHIGELQDLVDRIAAEGYSRSSVTDLVTLIRQIYRFAYPREMCTKEYGKYVLMPYTAEEKHHQDFNDTELQILWNHQDDPVVSMILIMCYSGFRISEFSRSNGMKTFLSTDRQKGYFRGGIKTRAGKDRVVPIHSAILPLIRNITDEDGNAVFLCGKTASRFRTLMKSKLVEIGIDSGSSCIDSDEREADSFRRRYHTPHSCRHTFSRLCESYGVNEADRRRMLGHAFGNDITNGVYGHRSIEELSKELEKIKLPKT